MCRLLFFIFPLFILLVFAGSGQAQTGLQESLIQSAQASEPTATRGHIASSHSKDESHAGHVDPFSEILLLLSAIIFAAVLGRALARALDQPAVLGELTIGVLLGNIGYWLDLPLPTLTMHLDTVKEIFGQVWTTGVTVSDAAHNVFSASEMSAGGVGERVLVILTGPRAGVLVVAAVSLWIFSNLGVILLLFMVGLESSVDEMMTVGTRALWVAIIGVLVPFALGYGVTLVLLPEAGASTALFLGATLCATSVGITARVFKDLNALDSKEAKIILGAAVIDDILGLIILAVVVGIVATGGVQGFEVARILGMSLAFLAIVVFFGDRILRAFIPRISRLDKTSFKLLFPLIVAFLMSWLASQIELATIVGAFAAGLIMSETHFFGYTEDPRRMDQLIAPLELLFAPIFFVLMGMQVNLAAFTELQTLMVSVAFIVIALVGKLVAGIPAGTSVDRLTVGIGMVPRGEVGLIFASIGKGLGVMTDSTFSAVVIMVMVTTLITPPGLKWSLARAKAKGPTNQPESKDSAEQTGIEPRIS